MRLKYSRAQFGDCSSPFTQYDTAFINAYAAEDWAQINTIANEEVRDPQVVINAISIPKDRELYSTELHYAIRINDVAQVRALVDKHTNPDSYKSIRRQHIFIAALLPRMDVLAVLLEFDNEYHTRANHLMLNAAENENLSLLKFALENGANCTEWRGKLFYDYMDNFHSRAWLETILKAGFLRNPDYLSNAGLVFEMIHHVYQDCIEELPDGDYLNDIDVVAMIFKPLLDKAGKAPMDVLGDLPPHLTMHCLRLVGNC